MEKRGIDLSEYIQNVFSKINQVYVSKRKNGNIRLELVNSGKPQNIGILELRKQENNYSIVTVYPRDIIHGKLEGKKIWQYSAPAEIIGKQQTDALEPLSAIDVAGTARWDNETKSRNNIQRFVNPFKTDLQKKDELFQNGVLSELETAGKAEVQSSKPIPPGLKAYQEFITDTSSDPIISFIQGNLGGIHKPQNPKHNTLAMEGWMSLPVHLRGTATQGYPIDVVHKALSDANLINENNVYASDLWEMFRNVRQHRIEEWRSMRDNVELFKQERKMRDAFQNGQSSIPATGEWFSKALGNRTPNEAEISFTRMGNLYRLSAATPSELHFNEVHGDDSILLPRTGETFVRFDKGSLEINGKKSFILPKTLEPNTPKGRIIVDAVNSTVELFKNADISTLAHEGAHHYRNFVQSLIDSGRATPELISLMKTAAQWESEQVPAQLLNEFTRYSKGKKFGHANDKAFYDAYQDWTHETKRDPFKIETAKAFMEMYDPNAKSSEELNQIRTLSEDQYSAESQNLTQFDTQYQKILNAFISEELAGDESFDLGQTPEAFIRCGIEQNPVSIRSSIFKKAVEKHHLTPDMLRQIPQALYNPVMIFDSSLRSTNPESGRVVLTEIRNRQNNPVIVASNIGKHTQRHIINDIASIHGRNRSQIELMFAEDPLRYVHKKRALEFARSHRLYLPKETTLFSATNDTVYDDTAPVKSSNKKV